MGKQLSRKKQRYRLQAWQQELHTFNGGVDIKKRRTKAFRQTFVVIYCIPVIEEPRRYMWVDGRRRRIPATLPLHRRKAA